MPSRNLSSVMCTFMLLKHLSSLVTSVNSKLEQRGWHGVVWSGFSGQLRNVSCGNMQVFGEQGVVGSAVLYIFFPNKSLFKKQNNFPRPSELSTPEKAFRSLKLPKDLMPCPHMPRNRSLLFPRITGHSFSLLSLLLLKNIQTLCRIS